MKKSILALVCFQFSIVILQAQDKLFWGDQEVDVVFKTNAPDLTPPETVTDVQNPSGIAWFNTETTYKLFYAIANHVYRNTNDGTGADDIIDTSPNQFNRGIAVDYLAKKIYWANQLLGTINRANLDGTNQEPVLSGLTQPWDIELDLVNQKIYWTEDEGNGKINRANLSDGSSVTPVITNIRSYGVAVDPARNKIFYTDVTNKKVFAANLADGSGATAIVSTAITTPADIDVDYATGKIYYTDYGADRIKRFNADGTGGRDIIGHGLFVEYADMTTPSVASIKRQSPTAADVEEGQTLTLRVEFSEPVLSVDAADFKLNGTLTGVLEITHISERRIYDVAVSAISGLGVLNLDLVAAPTLVDFRGNGLSGTVTTEETFTIHEAAVTGIADGQGDDTPRLHTGPTPGTMVLETRSLEGKPGKFVLYELTGREQYTEDAIMPGNKEFSTSNLRPGLYLLTVTANKKRFTWKMAVGN
jgi:hypothetical protein